MSYGRPNRTRRVRVVVPLNVVVAPELDEAIRVAAFARGVSKAKLVRSVLYDWLIQNSDGAAQAFERPRAEVSPRALAGGAATASSPFELPSTLAQIARAREAERDIKGARIKVVRRVGQGPLMNKALGVVDAAAIKRAQRGES